MRGGSPSTIVKSLLASPRARFVFSPDGNFMLYAAASAHSDGLFLTRYPTGAGKWPVPQSNGNRAVWSRDGRSLYLVLDNRLMTASFTASPAVSIGEPRMLFDATPLNVTLDRNFLSDGTVIAVQDLPPDKRQIVLVQNWFAEFRDEEK